MNKSLPAAFSSGGVEGNHYSLNNKETRRKLREWEKRRPNGKPHTVGVPRGKFGSINPG